MKNENGGTTINEALLRMLQGLRSVRRVSSPDERPISEQIIIPGTQSAQQLFEEAQRLQQEYYRNKEKNKRR